MATIGAEQELTCPSCGSKGPFTLRRQEWAYYTYDDGDDLEALNPYESVQVPGLNYELTCTCGAEFQAKPWE